MSETANCDSHAAWEAKKKKLPANVPYPAGIKDNFKNIQKENTDTKQATNEGQKEETAVIEKKNLEQGKQGANEPLKDNGKETK